MGVDFSTTVSLAGAYTVREDARCPDNTDAPFSVDFTVGEGLGGSIAVSPDPAVVNQTATLSATPTGGNPGYSYAWTVDGTAVPAVSGSPFEADYTFTTTGSHTVSVRISDNDQGNFQQTHTTVITRTISVVEPSSGGPPPPPPPPCVKRVAFKLSEFTTDGCFTQTSSSPQRWQTRSAIKLNGIPLPGFGQTFVITGPTAGEPGGHFTAPNSTMQLDHFTAFSGNIDWSLPDGGAGDEEVLRSFTVAPGATLAGLQVQGTIGLNLGEDASGSYYASFPLSIQLPASFEAGPDPSFGSVTGAASLRVDDAGIHYDGLRLEAENVWVQAQGRQRLLLLHTFRRDVHGSVRHADVRRRRRAVHPMRFRRDHEPLGRQRGRRAPQRPSARGVRRPCERDDLQARRIHREPRQAGADHVWRVSRPCRVRAVSQSNALEDQGQYRRQLPG
jgi:hypothetical protein